MEIDSNESLKTLEKYIDVYMEKLPEMLKENNDKWVVIGEKGISEFFDNDEQAYESGTKLYGESTFLIRQVSDEYIKYGKFGRPILIPRISFFR